MKQLKKVGLTFLAVIGMGVASAQSQRVINFSQLPNNAQSFIKTHFSAANVTTAWEEIEYLSQKEFNVILSDGTEIEFLANGEWEEVKARGGQVPAKIIPTAIAKYIESNFPNVGVQEIKKRRRGYEVELSNGLDIDFNKNGKFVRIDD